MRDVLARQHEHLETILHAAEHTEASGLGFTSVGLLFEHVERYLNRHFAAEETFMRDHAFPGLVDHQAEHNDCRLRVAHFKANVVADAGELTKALQFLRCWLAEHEVRSDQRFADFISSQAA